MDDPQSGCAPSRDVAVYDLCRARLSRSPSDHYPSLSALCAPLAAFFTCTHHLATRRRKLFSRRRRQHCLHASCCRPQPDRTRIWFVFASRRRSEGENCTRPSEAVLPEWTLPPVSLYLVTPYRVQSDQTEPPSVFSQKVSSRSRRMSAENWSVYLILCENGAFYCGISNRPQERFTAHLSGKGAKYTRFEQACRDAHRFRRPEQK